MAGETACRQSLIGLDCPVADDPINLTAGGHVIPPTVGFESSFLHHHLQPKSDHQSYQ